ncbi:endoglucanase [bacterium]|nr:endoglucanase [bacterium]
MKRKKILILFLVWGITFSEYSCFMEKTSPSQSSGSTGMIDADDPNIQYIGRFNLTDPKKAVFDWPGVAIRARFEGTRCSIRLRDGKNLYDVTIDDTESRVLQTDTSTVYPAATGLTDTVHTILIEKRTETFIGKGEFLGFILDDNKGLIPLDAPSDRRIEYIGNSITCGYGVEGPNASSPFTPETENAALSYAALIGRALNADYAMVAYSGKGVVRNYGDPNKTSPDPMPGLYDRTCCADSVPVWDYTGWIPQVVVINLGTNDFSTQPHPDKSVFQEAYIQLINRVQSQYSGVTIFCICGLMIGEPCAGDIKEVVNQCQENNANRQVYYIAVSTSLLTGSDRGSDWHPNVQGQQKIADVILPIIRDRMNGKRWKKCRWDDGIWLSAYWRMLSMQPAEERVCLFIRMFICLDLQNRLDIKGKRGFLVNI